MNTSSNRILTALCVLLIALVSPVLPALGAPDDASTESVDDSMSVSSGHAADRSQTEPVETAPVLSEEARAVIYQNSGRHVVGVASAGRTGVGLIVDERLVVTAATNVHTAHPIALFLPPPADDIDGEITRVGGTLLHVDSELGLALVRVSEPLSVTPTIPGERAHIGETVAALCASNDIESYQARLLTGHVSSLGDDGRRELLLDDDSSCGTNWWVGGIGAPVSNRDGELLGVVIPSSNGFAGPGALQFVDAATVLELAATSDADMDVPLVWDAEILFDYGMEVLGVSDGSVLLTVGMGVRVTFWDRMVALASGSVLLGGPTDGTPDDVSAETHVGGKGDFGLGYRWLLSGPSDTPMHLELLAGVSLIDLTRVSELSDGSTERTSEFLVQPLLKATFRMADFAEVHLFGRVDPEHPERSSFGFGTGFSF